MWKERKRERNGPSARPRARDTRHMAHDTRSSPDGEEMLPRAISSASAPTRPQQILQIHESRDAQLWGWKPELSMRLMSGTGTSTCGPTPAFPSVSQTTHLQSHQSIILALPEQMCDPCMPLGAQPAPSRPAQGQQPRLSGPQWGCSGRQVLRR